jgi:hypothetical protein
MSNVDCPLVEAATYILLDNGTQYAEALVYEVIKASLFDNCICIRFNPALREWSLSVPRIAGW